MRKFSILLALVAGLFISEAKADFTGKDASAATITFKNPGACASVVCVPVMQIYDGTNVVTLTTAGADAVSNTLTGQPVYARMQSFNGTTWDRWQGAVTATLAAETTKVIGTVRVASGGIASGSVAAGALAAGALATGAAVDGWNLTQGAIADAAVAAGATGTDSAKLRAISRDVGTIATNSALPLPAQSTHTVNIGAVDSINPYPATATPYTATATGTTGATTATLAGASSVTTYICGFSIRANATAAATGNATVTGVITATMNFTQWTAPNASGLGITEMIFSPCIPASGTNQSVAVVSAAPGTGGVVSVTAWGYKL